MEWKIKQLNGPGNYRELRETGLSTADSKMAVENSNRSKLKTYTSAKKNTLTLVTLQSFSISGVIPAEKIKLKIEKFTGACMTGAIMPTSSHTNVCKFFK